MSAKVVILAGGLGSRLSEETTLRPKPMVEIGGKPILWHVMKIYSHYGFQDFIICLGHKGYVIKEYFANYFLHTSDVTFHLSENRMEIHRTDTEPWRVTLVDTGGTSQTGGRIKRILPYVEKDPYFALTYGDGLGNVDIPAQVAFHTKHKKMATVTAVRPNPRFGALQIENDRVTSFAEKPGASEGWINGGFFLLSPQVGQFIPGDDTVWEHGPLEALVKNDELRAFHHDGFWQPMDTIRDRNVLEDHWSRGQAPWKMW